MMNTWHTIRISVTVLDAIKSEALGMHDTYDKILKRKYKINIERKMKHGNETKNTARAKRTG